MDNESADPADHHCDIDVALFEFSLDLIQRRTWQHPPSGTLPLALLPIPLALWHHHSPLTATHPLAHARPAPVRFHSQLSASASQNYSWNSFYAYWQSSYKALRREAWAESPQGIWFHSRHVNGLQMKRRKWWKWGGERRPQEPGNMLFEVVEPGLPSWAARTRHWISLPPHMDVAYLQIVFYLLERASKTNEDCEDKAMKFVSSLFRIDGVIHFTVHRGPGDLQ